MTDQNVDRFSPDGFEGALCKSDDGDWVRYEDYEKLNRICAEIIQEADRLRAELALASEQLDGWESTQ